MLANNVRETSSSTGVGNFVLLGASQNGVIFANRFSVADSERFNYVIDDRAGNYEIGIGYLFDSVTLIRETILDSSNGGNIVNFTAGTKDVFVSVTSSVFPRQRLNNVSNKRITSALITDADTVVPMNANRINYIPFRIECDVEVNALGCFVQTASPIPGTLLLGLYETGTLFEPGRLKFEVSLNPLLTGAQQGAVTTTKLKAGWYWVAAWCDTTPALRGGSTNGCVNSNIFVSNTGIKATSYRGSLTSLTSLPDPAQDVSSIDNNFFNLYLVEA